VRPRRPEAELRTLVELAARGDARAALELLAEDLRERVYADSQAAWIASARAPR